MVMKPTNVHLCLYAVFITISNSNELFQKAACCCICHVIITPVHSGCGLIFKLFTNKIEVA